MIAVIGGALQRFAGHSEYYQQLRAQFGFAPGPVGLHAIGHIAETDAEAADTFWPIYRSRMETLVRERGFPRPDRARYQNEIETGALFVGAPESVARKVIESARTLGLARFDLKYDTLGTSVHDRAQTVELFGTAVKPLVAKLSETPGPAAGTGRQ
jgi:alkanesulfonate monooxygenase SsuD/methylene tetrahydromethanopterin reductase-like flavin-dependent oxidoreductase (luciferase family)